MPGALTEDYFQARLQYGQTRVILYASCLAPSPGPRFTVHGTEATFVKYGLDSQEGQLKAGLRPPRPDWGLDPNPGSLSTFKGGALSTRVVPSLPGDYPAYYVALREALLGQGPNPVPPAEAIRTMGLMELGGRSAAEGRTLTVSAADVLP